MKTALAALCAVACALLVYAEHRRAATMRVIAKVVASLAFLALGICARHSGDYGTWIVAGLALGVAGDIALLGESQAAFMAGLGAFLLGHVAYVIAIATVIPPASWLAGASYLAVLPVAVAGFALVKLWPRLGTMRVPVIAYVLVIVTMVIGALALRTVPDTSNLAAPQAQLMGTIAPAYSRAHELFAAGALLFFASDLAVARDKFVGASFANKAWGLPAYYGGQLLIAWSLAV
jgi:uncharacterized membrane protein YhhN